MEEYKKLDDNYIIVVGSDENPAKREDLTEIKKLIRDINNPNETDLITNQEFYIAHIPKGKRIFKVGSVRTSIEDIEEDMEYLRKEIKSAQEEKRPIVFYHYIQVEVL